MLINPSLHNFLENIIFDFQITIDKVHPVQISSRSDNCITTDIMRKSQKVPKKVSKIGVWSLLYSQNQIFPVHTIFGRW